MRLKQEHFVCLPIHFFIRKVNLHRIGKAKQRQQIREHSTIQLRMTPEGTFQLSGL